MPRRPAKRSASPTSIFHSNNPKNKRPKGYHGDKEKLVVAIDIGRRSLPFRIVICALNVSSWPEQSVSDPKVPSVLLYDNHGNVMAWGAQTTHEDVKDKAEQNGWIRTQWFKLNLRPPHLKALIWPPGTRLQEPETQISESFSVQDAGKALDAYTTFLHLVRGHLEADFCKHHDKGAERWRSLYPTLEIIFTIPNGWEFRQHNLIRQAAVTAGLIGMGLGMVPGRDAALDRVRFVSEAEAAIVYAADSGNLDSWLQPGRDVILCDAGGGTIDITVYSVVKTYPLELKEKVAPRCVIAGAVFVNEAAEIYLRNKLCGTELDSPSNIHYLMDEFERDLKKRFLNDSLHYGIGRPCSEYNGMTNVRNGRLFIPGRDIAAFFEHTLSAIETNILDVFERSGKTATNVIMVGGFMNSPYAYSKLEQWGKRYNFDFTKPDGVLAKAISHGALLRHLSNPVKGYIAKVHYGSDVSIPAEEVHGDTDGRYTIARADGVNIYEKVWQSIVSMDQELPLKGAVRSFEKLVAEHDPEEELMLHEKIYIYRGEQVPIFMVDRFTDLTLPEFEHVCTIVVDLRNQYNMIPWSRSPVNGKKFKTLDFDITVKHDGYDIKAFSSWKLAKSKYTSKPTIIQPPQ